MVRSLHAFSTKHLPRSVSHNRCAQRTEPLKKTAPKPVVHARRKAALAPQDEALLADIRLLGRMLGDAIREHEGTDAFDLIERIRRLSAAYRLKRDAAAGRTLRSKMRCPGTRSAPFFAWATGLAVTVTAIRM
jgi:phosphoenolpyruvate carboxylase